MSVLDRGLLFILGLGGFILSVLFFLLGIGVFENWSMNFVAALYQFPTNVSVIVASLVFALISLRFVFYRIGSSDVDYVLLPGEHGHIRISFETIKQLANRTGKAIRGVQEFETRVRSGQSGVLLSVRVRALPDVQLSVMSSDIQTQVKEYVEATSGISVEHVIVNIAEIATNTVKSSRAWVE